MIKYQSQKVALYYFIGALVLLFAQIVGGLLAGTVYVFPNFLSELVPFNVIRMIHTNALIVWLLMGFMGAAYYLVPEEAETELYSTKLAVLQFWLFMIGGLGAVISYLFGIHGGREFLEQPLWVKLDIVLVSLIFLFNLTMTVLKGRKTVITNILLLGLWGIAVFFMFAFYNPDNLVLDKTFWWFVVHLWVEGVWELVMASILAFMMVKMTGVDREVVEKWLYVIIGMALFSGILGMGHHYYWIGLPAYWQWIGSIFSTIEVLPFFSMVVFTFYLMKKGQRNHPNKAALLWSVGCSVMAFLGAGVWGFMLTLAPVNYYAHGTQITAAHGHLAFYGAYVMLNIAIFTFAMPNLLNRQPYNQALSIWSFWITTLAMVVMTSALTIAGIIQTQLQRVNGEYFMDVQDQLSVFYTIRLGAGVFVLIGILLLIVSFIPFGKKMQVGSLPQAAE